MSGIKIIWDADWLVNLPDVYDVKDNAKLPDIISDTFMTDTGAKIARELYLWPGGQPMLIIWPILYVCKISLD